MQKRLNSSSVNFDTNLCTIIIQMRLLFCSFLRKKPFNPSSAASDEPKPSPGAPWCSENELLLKVELKGWWIYAGSASLCFSESLICRRKMCAELERLHTLSRKRDVERGLPAGAPLVKRMRASRLSPLLWWSSETFGVTEYEGGVNRSRKNECFFIDVGRRGKRSCSLSLLHVQSFCWRAGPKQISDFSGNPRGAAGVPTAGAGISGWCACNPICSAPGRRARRAAPLTPRGRGRGANMCFLGRIQWVFPGQ